MTAVRSVDLRTAVAGDAEAIARLHAESWRQHYRGAYADQYLDGDVLTERRAVWSEHFASPAGTRTLVAEHDGRLVGFVHVVFDASPTWGSLVDNLHVVTDWHRAGVGTRLLAHAATAVTDEATRQPLYLWVLEQNTAAQCFYQALGAVCVETAPVPAPGGDPARLAGSPSKLRMTWPDAAKLTRLSRA